MYQEKNEERQVISVFGSNQPKPGEPDFETARELGQQLADAGFTVATGGYLGTMWAVSQGASERGGQVIGVTCDEIEGWRPVNPNPYITREIRYHTLWERLTHLVTHNQGVIALPGGVGTLAEVALTWSQLQVEAMTVRPFILLGDMWHQTMQSFINPTFVADRYRALLSFAQTPQEAVRYLAGEQAI